MTFVLVHGLPESAAIWRPVQRELGDGSIAIELPGFGTPTPDAFTATKDDYVDWLEHRLRDIDGPIDLVGHDMGALLVLRVVTRTAVEVRSWAVDVANLFHPDSEWNPRVQELVVRGKELLEAGRADRAAAVARMQATGLPADLADEVVGAADATMDECIVAFYRSAQPNVATDWWTADLTAQGNGLVLLLPDPPQIEAQSLEVAAKLGAQTERLQLDHCWMAQDPEQVARLLLDLASG